MNVTIYTTINCNNLEGKCEEAGVGFKLVTQGEEIVIFHTTVHETYASLWLTSLIDILNKIEPAFIGADNFLKLAVYHKPTPKTFHEQFFSQKEGSLALHKRRIAEEITDDEYAELLKKLIGPEDVPVETRPSHVYVIVNKIEEMLCECLVSGKKPTKMTVQKVVRKRNQYRHIPNAQYYEVLVLLLWQWHTRENPIRFQVIPGWYDECYQLISTLHSQMGSTWDLPKSKNA